MNTKTQKLVNLLPKIMIKSIEYAIICFLFFVFLYSKLVFRKIKTEYIQEKSNVIKSEQGKLVLVIARMGDISKITDVEVFDSDMNLYEKYLTMSIWYRDAFILELSHYPDFEHSKIKIHLWEGEIVLDLKRISDSEMCIADMQVFRRY